jgi:hypothetical protein
MDSSNIELNGSCIASVDFNEGVAKVRFEPAFILKTMTGSVERTKWKQNVTLIFEDAELISTGTTFPCTCSGGDISENIYTYRDMIPIPLSSRGRIGCKLKLMGTDNIISINGNSIQLVVEGTANYIEHIRSE